MNGIRDLVRWCINTVYMACSRVANYVRRNDFPQSGHDMIEGGDNVTPRADRGQNQRHPRRTNQTKRTRRVD
ncbi:hypothetical protein L798_10796 [Zootermopsis nevadensis]|uniref:Uncharacterized protein n=1 Tax=Zootermopsis nevadensis TaxID=136037 RepID=A0A067RVM2_ZOONE|nr:hypothetical protein L798_10796 [Zootermopsis nevadensis]